MSVAVAQECGEVVRAGFSPQVSAMSHQYGWDSGRRPPARSESTGMESESPELIQSTLKSVGFSLAEHGTDRGFVATAHRGQRRVMVTAPTSAAAWSSCEF